MFADDTKLERVTDKPEKCTAIQKVLNRLEKWANRNLVKFNKGIYQVVALETGAGWGHLAVKQLCR